MKKVTKQNCIPLRNPPRHDCLYLTGLKKGFWGAFLGLDGWTAFETEEEAWRSLYESINRRDEFQSFWQFPPVVFMHDNKGIGTPVCKSPSPFKDKASKP